MQHQPQKIQLLKGALAGCGESLGQLLALYENYLRLLVLAQFEQRLCARLSPSDVLQETYFEVHRDFHQFRGASISEFIAWIRQILIHNLRRAAEQHLHAARRDVRREVKIEDLAGRLEQSAMRLDALVDDAGTSPSQHLERDELQLRLANVIAELPPDYRDVIVMRHFRGWSFDAIAGELGRSAGASRMLWLRAIRQLQQEFER